MLVLERGLHLLELLRLAVELVDDDAPARRPHHRHREVHVGAVGALRQVDAEHRVGGPGVPELDGLVPAAGHQGGVVAGLHPPAHPHRGLVLSDLYRTRGSPPGGRRDKGKHGAKEIFLYCLTKCSGFMSEAGDCRAEDR